MTNPKTVARTGAPDPLREMSDGSLIATIRQMIGELLRRTYNEAHTPDGAKTQKLSNAVPFSRAKASDYLRIVALWNEWRQTHDITVPKRDCPACKSPDGEFIFRSYDTYDYHSCRNCGAWYVPLAIDDSVIDAFFADVPEAKSLSDNMMTGRDARTRDGDRARFDTYFDIISKVVSPEGRKLRYVDIGCGVGHSIELADERGWDAVGFETSHVAVATAQAAGRHVVHPDDWLSERSCDIVSLFETLEHITDPDPVMTKARAQLDRNGLVFITVPNRSCFEVSILKDKCFHVFGGSENVGHINLLDAKSLGVLLSRHGLKLMFVDGQFSSDLLQIISRLNDDHRSVLDLMQAGRIDITLPEQLYVLINNLGPAMSTLERMLARSPILMGLACRTEDEASMTEAFAALEEHRRAEMMSLLDGLRTA